MELDWSTIVLEIVNFLVLVWILKRFLYKPVLDVIAKRRAGIEEMIARAETTSATAESLKQQYEGRLADWERERAAARAGLRAELDAERNRLMAELQADIAQEREKARVAEERRLAEAQRRNEQIALAQSAVFAAKLLKPLAGPELDRGLAALTLSGLSGMPAEMFEALRRGAPEGTAEGEVASARPLDAALREGIDAALRKIFGAKLRCRHSEDASLVAGLRISVGAWVFSGNIRDELKGFAELSNEPAAH